MQGLLCLCLCFCSISGYLEVGYVLWHFCDKNIKCFFFAIFFSYTKTTPVSRSCLFSVNFSFILLGRVLRPNLLLNFLYPHVLWALSSLLMLIFLLSANCPPFYMRLKFGVLLLLPNCPFFHTRLKCQINKVSAHPDRHIHLHLFLDSASLTR